MLYDKIFRLFVKFNIFIYRVTRGAIGANARGMQHLIITTTGAKSGMPRTQALTAMIKGDIYYVVASNHGKKNNPAWWHNLTAHPEVVVQFGAEAKPMVAQTLRGAERDAIWPDLISYNYRWSDYQNQAARELPVVRLSRVSES